MNRWSFVPFEACILKSKNFDSIDFHLVHCSSQRFPAAIAAHTDILYIHTYVNYYLNSIPKTELIALHYIIMSYCYEIADGPMAMSTDAESSIQHGYLWVARCSRGKRTIIQNRYGHWFIGSVSHASDAAHSNAKCEW